MSETFLLREINALDREGLRIQLLAMAPGNQQPVHEGARQWLERGVLYRPRFGSRNLWLGAAAGALRWPVGTWSALLMALGLLRREPHRAREIFVSLFSAAYFAWILRGQGLQHVHATFASVPATVGLFMAEILGVSFSFAAHARDLFTSEATFLDLKAREAEFVVTCTEVGYQHLLKVFPVRARSRLHLIRHGVDLTQFTPRLKVPHERPYLLSAGRLVAKKGFLYLLRAAQALVGRDLDFDLHIYGSGPQRAEIEQQITGLQIRDCVHLHDAVTEEEMVKLYQEADVFVLASVQAPDGDNEGVPNVLVEALAMEVPAVATRTGGIPELIQHGVTGLLAEPGDPVDLADQMERLLRNSRLRSDFAAAGRIKVEREYDLHKNVAKLYRLLRQVVR
ncbi:MAG: glycosyltransferase family 4 protein [Armatimonadetes bacterium]|nr:glycosyltransferase family 4 protein [Armatimonadota bacterium]